MRSTAQTPDSSLCQSHIGTGVVLAVTAALNKWSTRRVPQLGDTTGRPRRIILKVLGFKEVDKVAANYEAHDSANKVTVRNLHGLSRVSRRNRSTRR
jgi:hypothetical protein